MDGRDHRHSAAVGTMTYHDEHHHWHLDGVMKYELLNAKMKPVKPNAKVAFCLADVAVVDSTLPGFPTAPAYNGCDPRRDRASRGEGLR